MQANLKKLAMVMGATALLGSFSSVAVAQSNRLSRDPAASYQNRQAVPIPGRYIVVMKDDVVDPSAEADKVFKEAKVGTRGRVHGAFRHTMKGFAASIPDASIESVRRNPRVKFVEQDMMVYANQTSPTYQATWGLDRLDQVDRPLDTVYNFSRTGAGVTAFIIDTGIRSDHIEFTGRLLPGLNKVADANGTNDCQGHGTHVAGIVGGSVYGVAKAVKLVPVRVLGCDGGGSLSNVIAGIDWVANHTARPAVANLSLGSAKSSAVNAAVAAAVAKGVTMVVAAGNDGANACNYSPASEPSAITVGASTIDDARASYSNYGSCVDIFAPGSNISSAWFSASNAGASLSGTSMASPHVAGLAALALQANPAATPAEVTNFVLTTASVNKVSSVGTGSPNRLAYAQTSSAPVSLPKASVAIKSLVASSTKSRRNWSTTVTASVFNTSNAAAVAGATVSATFNPGAVPVSCVTGTAGTCQVKATIGLTTTSVTLTPSNITGANLQYNAGYNAINVLTINRP